MYIGSVLQDVKRCSECGAAAKLVHLMGPLGTGHKFPTNILVIRLGNKESKPKFMKLCVFMEVWGNFLVRGGRAKEASALTAFGVTEG